MAKRRIGGSGGEAPASVAAGFVFYQGPAGGPSDRLCDPTEGQILEVLRGQETSWDTNIGQARMAWHTDRRAARLGVPPAGTKVGPSLVMLRNRSRGWYFEYSDWSRRELATLVPYDEARQRGRRVGHFASDCMYLLPGCFVCLEAAEHIVLDFLRTGLPSPAVRWVDADLLRSRIAGDERDRSAGPVVWWAGVGVEGGRRG